MSHFDFWALAWNKPLLGALASMAGAQVLKFLVALAKRDKGAFSRLFDYGGFPSGHTALICSATAGTGFAAGFDSALFAIAAAVASIMVYDILKLRRVVELQGREIVALQAKLGMEALPGKPQFRSHSKAEVLAGGLWGIACAATAAMM